MKKKLLERRTYVSPAIEVGPTAFDQQLLSTSFPNSGGHEDGNDDGQDLNAKQGIFDEEDEDATPEPKFGSIW